jgi:crotonobetainyl-CoA:carnitine CoA-transferase CaiB-like acyl-CoA transferase
VAILAALRRRDCGGGGAHIDMALLDTQIAVLGLQAVSWMVSGEVPRRSGNGHFVLVPYQAFDTADGELIVAVGNDAQFARLCDVLGLDLADDCRFETNAGRVAHRELLLDALADAIRGWPKQTLADRLEECGVPAGPINHVDDAFADPHVIHRGLHVAPGGIPGVASPIVIDGERMVSDIPPPPRAV